MIGSTDIQVTTAKQDQRNVGLRAAESLGYFGLGHRSSQIPDFDNFILGQEFLETGDKPCVDGVLFVGSIIDPFEVRRGEIYFYPIDVIDHREIGWIGDESDSDESVDVDRLSFSISEQNDLWVSHSVDTPPDHMTEASTHAAQSMFVNANTVNASHSSEVADFVESFEVGDASPFFIDHPVGPFARSAHSIVLSSTTQGGGLCP